MKSDLECTSTLNAAPASDPGCRVPVARPARELMAAAAVVGARLRQLAPYALIEIVLPGGSMIALLLWLYRRKRAATHFVTDEIAALM